MNNVRGRLNNVAQIVIIERDCHNRVSLCNQYICDTYHYIPSCHLHEDDTYRHVIVWKQQQLPLWVVLEHCLVLDGDSLVVDGLHQLRLTL